MPTVSTPRKLATGLLLLLAAGCAEGPTSVNQGNLGLLTERTSLSVFLTDGPGNVDAVWADIEKLTIEGQPGKIDLLDGPTGLIEVTELINGQLEQLVNAADLPAGKYTRLMAVIGDAVLLADDGSVYVKGNPNLEAVLDPAIIPETLGALVCPSCTSSGFKIILPGGQTVLEEGAAALVLDFDIRQSFGDGAGASGEWVMDPVIHATKVKDQDADGDILDDLILEPALSGTVVFSDFPLVLACATHTPTLQDFVPTATARTLVDDVGQSIVRTAVVDASGSFEIRPLAGDVYDLDFVHTIDLGDATLQFDATVSPLSADATLGPVEGVTYTVSSIMCMPKFPF